MPLACSRALFFMVFLAGALGLGVSYYLEYAVGLTPCGLCLLQRLFLVLFTAVSLVATWHGPQRFGGALYWLLNTFSCLAGLASAWRQVLLQSDPMLHLSCPAVVSEVSWGGALKRVLRGCGSCSEASWTLFDLTVPEWSLLFFIAMLLLGLHQLWRLVWFGHVRPLDGRSSRRGMTGD